MLPGLTRSWCRVGVLVLAGWLVGVLAQARPAAASDWALQSVPVNGVLEAVSCTAASSCMAVGYSPGGYNNFPNTLAVRWDGTAWSVVPTASPDNQDFLYGITCTAANACTAVGTSYGHPLAERWNGSAWSLQKTPLPTGADTAA